MILWLASYPRSGNTFLRIVLNQAFGLQTYSIYNDIDDIQADEETCHIVGHKTLPKDFSIQQARAAKECYMIKTHELPIEKDEKAIYVIRDGRQCISSYKNYIDAYDTEKKELLDIIYGDGMFGSWSDHVASWNSSMSGKILLIKQEDLIDNPMSYIEKISEFIDKEPLAMSIPSFTELNKINPKFFRSGKKDSWKSAFSDRAHTIFWLEHGAQMEKYGYAHDKPSVFRDKLE